MARATFTPHVIAQRTKVVVVAVVILAIAFLCQLIAIVTPGWLCTPDVFIGLFIYCGSLTVQSRTKSLYECNPILSKDTPGSLQAVRLMAVVSTAIIFVSFITCSYHLWLVVRHEKINKKLVAASVILSVTAVIITLTASILFGVHTKHNMPSDLTFTYDLFYSFALYVVGGTFTILGAVIVGVSLRSLIRMLLV